MTAKKTAAVKAPAKTPAPAKRAPAKKTAVKRVPVGEHGPETVVATKAGRVNIALRAEPVEEIVIFGVSDTISAAEAATAADHALVQGLRDREAQS